MNRIGQVSFLFLSGYLVNGCGGGSATHPRVATFLVTAGTFPSATVAAGTSFNVTVTALDTSGGASTTYSGTVHFTSSDAQAVLPANSKVTNGTGTFSVTLRTVGGQTITATDTARASITGTSNSINVSATPLAAPSGIVGQAYGESITISPFAGCTLRSFGWELETSAEGPAVHLWSWSAAPGSSLPPGLAISAVSKTCGIGAPVTLSAWIVGGVPTAAGTYNVILTGPPGSAAYTLTITGAASAAAATKEVSTSLQHAHYKLLDLGTLGGPHSYGSVNGDGFQLLNNSGEVASFSDLATLDPNAPNCYVPDCSQAHAFLWKGGVMTDIGAFPGMLSSAAGSINSRGWATGQSQNGLADSDFFCGGLQCRAVLWKQDHIEDLGTLGGDLSLGIYVNDAGQVVGISNNGVPDAFSLFGVGDQLRTFLWEDGVMHDIGTLGGPDALPAASCGGQPRNVIVGLSFINFTPNVATGVPTIDPFLWKNGVMTDLGNLGGTMSSAQCANHRGQIIGMSTLAGDAQNHAFFWEEQSGISDLGTLGGDNSEAIWLSEAGGVAGSADLPGSQVHHAVYWEHGKIHDLGTVPGDLCSRGRGLNSHGQVVGGSSDCHNFLHAFLWEGRGPMLDLNTLIQPGTGFQLTNAFNINDRGEILAKAAPIGFTPNDDVDLGHLVLLVPCQSTYEVGCDDLVDFPPATAAEPVAQKPASVPVHAAPLAKQAVQTTNWSNLSPADRMARIRSMLVVRRGRLGTWPQR